MAGLLVISLSAASWAEKAPKIKISKKIPASMTAPDYECQVSGVRC